ncbi:MAG: hypothetical protein K0Q79_2296 [Flavipsychrobacter sp.]|jgi:hypothetical protein|nr:hypothetical protein [Flavipsychrobacter sp.]
MAAPIFGAVFLYIYLMFFLQAAMGFGYVVVLIFGLLILVGVPILTRLFMEYIWRKKGKRKFIEKKTPYYKDPIWFILCMITSFVIVTIVFFFVLIFFDKLFPQYGFYN